MAKTFKLPTLKCLRCGHVWIPRKPQEPKKCARCASPYWDKAKWKGILKHKPIDECSDTAEVQSQPFRQYLRAIRDELVWATCHFKVWEDLWPSTEEIAHIENLYVDFFQLTRQAHNDQYLLRLSKILDKGKDNISLYKLVNCVEQRPSLLSNSKIDLTKIKAKLRQNEAVFGRLKTFRDKKLAHIDKHFHLNPNMQQSVKIYVGESRAILADLDEIVTEISICFDGTIPTFETTGIHNVKQLLSDLVSWREHRRKTRW